MAPKGDNFSSLADIRADGRFVAFWSLATSLVPGDTNNTDDVFVHDRVTGIIERVSVDSRGREKVADSGGTLNSNFGRPAISGDGRFVPFASTASNLVSHDTNNTEDVFAHHRQTGSTERIRHLSTLSRAAWRPGVRSDANQLIAHGGPRAGR